MEGIYKITNTINRKVYIGQSNNIEYRWKKHKQELKANRHVNEHLQSSYNKYGKQVFKFEVIEECDSSIINEKERYYIATYKATNRKYGYNISEGGKGITMNEEVRNKISESNKKSLNKEETKKKLREASKRVWSSKEYRKLMSEKAKKRQIGVKFSEESKLKKSGANAYQGKKVHSDILDKTFNTLKEAAEYVGINGGCKISECINNKRKCAGKHPVTKIAINDWKFVS